MTVIFILQRTDSKEIRLESLDNGPGLLPFKLGPTRIVTHYHSFIQSIDLSDLQDKIVLVRQQLDDIMPDLNNKTANLYEPHIDYLKYKIENIFEQLQTFRINRTKRGLIDGLGSVIKSISGNLDYTDALRYDNILKTLQENEDKLVTELNSHVSLSKEWTTQYTKIINNLVESQNQIRTLLTEITKKEIMTENDLIKYAHLAQVFLILGDNVDSISQELSKLQDALALIKISSLHHSLLNSNSIKYMINRLELLYSKPKIIDLDIREYYDILKIGSYYSDNKVVIVYRFPVVLQETYDMYKLSIIPNKNAQVLIPPHPFLAIHQTDSRYVETECPKTSKWYLCEEQWNLKNQTTHDCVQQLLIAQQKTELCTPTYVSLERPALEKLDEAHYTMIFPNHTKTHLSCEEDHYRILQGSYLAIIPHNCFIETSDFRISNSEDHIKGQPVKIMNLPQDKIIYHSELPSLKLNTINLDHLQASNLKISHQDLVTLKQDGNIVYHTTIPIYAIIVTASVIIGIISYRKVCHRKINILTGVQEEGVYECAPEERRVNFHQPPAQFTTKVFNSRCSTGGGVTPP